MGLRSFEWMPSIKRRQFASAAHDPKGGTSRTPLAEFSADTWPRQQQIGSDCKQDGKGHKERGDDSSASNVVLLGTSGRTSARLHSRDQPTTGLPGSAQRNSGDCEYDRGLLFDHLLRRDAKLGGSWL